MNIPFVGPRRAVDRFEGEVTPGQRPRRELAFSLTFVEYPVLVGLNRVKVRANVVG